MEIPRDRTHVYAALVAAVVIALLVGRASTAAFSATTDNAGNAFTVDTINLTDDAVGPLFTVTDLQPGQSRSACIQVTYDGDIDPDPVKVYSDGALTGLLALTDALSVTIEEGNATTTCAAFAGASIYTGTLTAFDGITTYATGSGTWDPAGDEMRPYRITVTLSASAPNTVQGESVTGLGFVWETQAG